MNFDDFDTQIQSDELEENFMEYNESMPCAPTMQKTLYYDMPTQVKFFDFDGEEPYWIGGIAFHDVVICGCCGATIEIADLYDEAEGLGVMCEVVYNNLDRMYYSDDEEDIDDAGIAMRESLGNNWW